MSKQTEGVSISVKTLLSFSAILFLLIGEYIVLHQEIEVAKELPENKISEERYTYDIKYIETEIKLLKEELEELKNE
tara:strand:- start:311 stop:541 length:231 start_codon:yes stop_codon:yes gene_type:complete